MKPESFKPPEEYCEVLEAELAPLFKAMAANCELGIPSIAEVPPPSLAFQAWCQQAPREALAARLQPPHAKPVASATVSGDPMANLHPAFRPTPKRMIKEPKNIPWVHEKMEEDVEEKKAVAEWVDSKYCLPGGAGVFFDAGSQCSLQWERTQERLLLGQVSHLSIVTSSALIIQNFSQKVIAHALRGTTVAIAGDIFDVEHLAFLGNSAKDRLMSRRFRPAIVYIGTSGIEFDGSSILFGYHAGDAERELKGLLFECPAKDRVILATPRKIGNAGGAVFDVLKLNGNAPIRLVTAEPPKGSPWRAQFDRALEIFNGPQMQKAFRNKKLTFRLTCIDPATKKAKTYPEENDHA
jgi:hypothetical protein